MQAQPISETDPSGAPTSLSIVKYGAKFQNAQQAPLQQARVFVYRQASAARTGPVNIYLESRFHTALLSGGYTEFCAAPGRLAIQSVYDDAQTLHLGKEAPGQPWLLKAGNTLYLRVNETNAVATPLLEIAPDPARKELALTAAQIHVLSRAPVALTCDSPAPLPPAAVAPAPIVAAKSPVPRAYALQADALFEFGKTELKVTGYNAIEAMAQRLKRDYSQVDRIRVIGHSDPIGKPKPNRELSLARAERVADQLRDRGVKPVQGFKVEGQGENSPVKTDCPKKVTPASKLCNEPNRRVEIIVYGAKN
jgi:OOP family OmpA-OmpF porin